MKTCFFSALLILVLCFGTNSYSQQYNRPVPLSLFPYEFVQNDTYDHGYFLATLLKINVLPSSSNYKSPYPIIFDSDGYILWYSNPNIGGLLNFQYHPINKEFSYTQVAQNQVNFVVLDSNLNIINSFQDQNGLEDTHEFLKAANGNWLFMTRSNDTVDLSAHTFNGVQGSAQTIIRGIGYQEIDPFGNIVFEWDANNYIDPLDSYDFYGYNPSSFDYCHGNAIAEDQDGHVLISQRHLNAIYKINRYTGDVIWILGGQSSDFTFTNDAGFSGQHDIRKLPNGNYSMFDNGNMSNQAIKTRGVEYSIDTINWTATRVDQILHPSNLVSTAMGSYRQLSNGEHLLGYGLVYQPYPVAALYNANQTISREFHFEDSVMTYRMLHAESLPLIRPEITCQNTTNGLTLTGPTGMSSYLWSTGETSSSITVTNFDTIQLWVPQGSGFIGSLPYYVNDLTSPCNLSLDELIALNEEHSFELFNLLGQKIDRIKPNQIYLKVWSNGRIEKIMEVE